MLGRRSLFPLLGVCGEEGVVESGNQGIPQKAFPGLPVFQSLLPVGVSERQEVWGGSEPSILALALKTEPK